MSAPIPTELPAIAAALDAAAQSAADAAAGTAGTVPGIEVAALRTELAGLLASAAAPGERPGPGPTELGRRVFGLLEALDGWPARSGRAPERRDLDRAVIGLAVWLARQGGRIEELEPVVNAIARVANATREPAELSEIDDLIGEIADAVAPVIQEDRGDQGPGRPWRVLHLNRAIVATRSHDPWRMERAFDALVRRLPGDAAGFFREGMAQMEALDYPGHVRAVMERYHRAWVTQTLH